MVLLNTPRLSTKSLSPEITSPGRGYGNDYAEIRPLLLDYRKAKAENDRLALRTKDLQERLEVSERQYRELAVQNEFLTRQYAELHRAAFSKSPPLFATSHRRSLGRDSGGDPNGGKLRWVPSQAAKHSVTRPADRSSEPLERPLPCTTAFPSPTPSPVRTKIAGRLRSLPLVEPNTVARRRISIEKTLPRSVSTSQLSTLVVPTPPSALGPGVTGTKAAKPSPPLTSDGPLRRISSASQLATITETPGLAMPKPSPRALDDALFSLPALKIGHRILDSPTPISRPTVQRSIPCQVAALPRPRQFTDLLDNMGKCHHFIFDQLAKEGSTPCGTDTPLSVLHRQQYHAFLQACLQSCHHAFGGRSLNKEKGHLPTAISSRPTSSSTPLSLSTPQSPIAAVSHSGGGLSFTLTSSDQCMLSSFDHSLVASPTVSYSSESSIAADPLLITLSRPSVDITSLDGIVNSRRSGDGNESANTDSGGGLYDQGSAKTIKDLPLLGKRPTPPAGFTQPSANLFARARQWLSNWPLGSVRQYRPFLSHPITALAVTRYLWLDSASLPVNTLISMTICGMLLLVIPRVALTQRTVGTCNESPSPTAALRSP
ncbi:hypothetical protein H4R34_001703 [Dimargaris verticillata]|uniref:Uncharacterized protein n=1 Tax=Dimargaris verticillata TaxID=2761393 RepID=A0A9W8B3X7_9FUNG|nr:hypothetical protein H4R34_001703 [Dimargaris verticillata]